MPAQVARRTFTTDEFHRMAEAGVFSDDDRLELVEGDIIEMSPIGSRHAACVDRLNLLFVRRLGRGAIVRVQNPIRLGRRSELQPDLAVVKKRQDYYAGRHPGVADVRLIVEVADTSGEYDRVTKIAHYARAGVPEVWLVDLPADFVGIYRQPALRGYRERQDYGRGRRVFAEAFPRTAFRINEVLG